ncbi:hypothetical protein [Lentzea guizhouensis]|uniref:hypothetical protein n=1 Tax=Lentzea guizhouensis TaxID=1586287 RepID=UPI001F2C41D7|nr:hypothetical protein [Lentzea guizhouensis]
MSASRRRAVFSDHFENQVSGTWAVPEVKFSAAARTARSTSNGMKSRTRASQKRA